MFLSTFLALVAITVTFGGPALGASSSASSCSTTLSPKLSITPTVASGYHVALIATGLTKPRSIKFDSKGNLLVVQQGAGIANLALKDDGGICLSVSNMQIVVENSAVSRQHHQHHLIGLTDMSIEAKSWACAIERWQDALCIFARSCIRMVLRC